MYSFLTKVMHHFSNVMFGIVQLSAKMSQTAYRVTGAFIATFGHNFSFLRIYL